MADQMTPPPRHDPSAAPRRRWILGIVLVGLLLGAKLVPSGRGAALPTPTVTPTPRSIAPGSEVMGTPVASGGALPAAGQHSASIVLETTDPRGKAFAAVLLRKNDDGSYTTTGHTVRVRWTTSFLPVVMGTPRDVHAGAILQIVGTSDGRAMVTAARMVVLTGYVTVNGGAGAPPRVLSAPGTVPRTWQVIAGFSQALPPGSDSTEAVNAFYPRVLTVYAGDAVTWTDNSTREPHTVTFGPVALLRTLEDPRAQMLRATRQGRPILLVNPAVAFPTARGRLVERDPGAGRTLLSCGAIGPSGVPTNPQSCTITFPTVGTYDYACLFHAGMPGNPTMDGTVRVLPRPRPTHHTWTIRAGSGTMTDADDGFAPMTLTIRAGDSVTWISGGSRNHTVSFGLDPRAVQEITPVGFGPTGPILAYNPRVVDPLLPRQGRYTGGVASSGLRGLAGNWANLPGQTFLATPFTLTFPRPGVYTYVCLVHAPFMRGAIIVVPATARVR